ncbi:uncharacterized protein LOC121880743 [Thunnus maccoyii]|uniref:uncharacterized protein LOC121880743 n=1 Tax=Thunnus maccoyii TaxID=8240 RepID=UPI001C4BF9E8|nr:uncharacterized protein LOC121880743 [Thunnus maccoyii]
MFINTLPSNTEKETEEVDDFRASIRHRSPKMANLWWITVTLTFFLSSGCLAAVDQNKLAPLIQQIRNLKGNQITGVYSVAVSMPRDDPYNPQKVPQLTQDNIKQINKYGLYKTGRLAFALKLQHSKVHAESRLLTDLHLVNQKGDMLVIFASDSPCYRHCANPKSNYTIIDKIKAVIRGGEWGNRFTQPLTEDVTSDPGSVCAFSYH